MQQFGTELLILADGLAERAREAEQLSALQAAGVPEEEPDETTDYTDFDPSQDDDVDLDYSAVDWDESVSPSDVMQMQAALANRRVEVVSDEQADFEDAPPVPDVEFDREWT